jgi:hypothetical protein
MIQSSQFGSLNHGPVADLNTTFMPLVASPASKSAFRGEAEVGWKARAAASVKKTTTDIARLKILKAPPSACFGDAIS